MKKTLSVLMIAAAMAFSFASASFAGDDSNPVAGFFNTVGETVSKIMPWNWGK